MELFGIKIYPFSYPFKPDRDALDISMKEFAARFDVSMDDVEKMKIEFDEIRDLAHRIDKLTYKDGRVTGFENHLYLVSTSDMKGDPSEFREELTEFLKTLESRKPKEFSVRLGYIGVPPICPDIYEYIENIGGKIVFNEIQRQFSMPFKTDDIVSQYTSYTYPYSIEYRIKDIEEQIEIRKLDGIIHYSQAFCSRQLDDMIFRKKLDIPILTIEADRPGSLEPKNAVKLEAFVDSLVRLKNI
jgi:benzoyl-CoA reductase/2-hydroxyglutaryl-CoA dehydratase subunit BcrC/BadD/HgdB